MYALLKSPWSLFAVPCVDIASIKNFIKHCAEVKLGEYELVMSSSDYVEGLHVQAKDHMHIGWQDWLVHGEHRHTAEHRHNYCAQQNFNWFYNITQYFPAQEKCKEAQVSLSSFYTSLEKALSLANAYGSSPYHVDNHVREMRTIRDRESAKLVRMELCAWMREHRPDVKEQQHIHDDSVI